MAKLKSQALLHQLTTERQRCLFWGQLADVGMSPMVFGDHRVLQAMGVVICYDITDKARFFRQNYFAMF